MAEAWSKEKRAKMSDKLCEAARIAARKLGARGVIVIAFWEDGNYIHAQDGWTDELPDLPINIYKQLISIYGMIDASGGEDVAVQ